MISARAGPPRFVEEEDRRYRGKACRAASKGCESSMYLGGPTMAAGLSSDSKVSGCEVSWGTWIDYQTGLVCSIDKDGKLPSNPSGYFCATRL